MNGLVLALSGGVGGAKLALGLSLVVPMGRLLVLANTADDFEHLGLRISPDLDSLTYALAGLDDPVRGWGRRDETWAFMSALRELGGETWFQLGDKDLAIHVERTRQLRSGQPLSEVTAEICRRLGVTAEVCPMTDDPVMTRLRTAEGWLDFQDYFVQRHCAPAVLEIAFTGAEAATPAPRALKALAQRDLRCVVLCPSNPLISIDPILSLPGMRRALADCRAPVVAVSPLIGGEAVKGPTAKMLRELGLPPSPRTIAEHYRDFLDGIIIDEADRAAAASLAMSSSVTSTLMVTREDRIALAQHLLDFAATLDSGPDGREERLT